MDRAISMRMDDDLIMMGKHRAHAEGFRGYQPHMKSVYRAYLTGELSGDIKRIATNAVITGPVAPSNPFADDPLKGPEGKENKAKLKKLVRNAHAGSRKAHAG